MEDYKQKFEKLVEAVAAYKKTPHGSGNWEEELVARERLWKAAGLPYSKWILDEEPPPGWSAAHR